MKIHPGSFVSEIAMIKIFFISGLVFGTIWVSYRLMTTHPDAKHPGVPLEMKPRVHHTRLVLVKQVKIQIRGARAEGCNRVILNSGTCDALPYTSPDWSQYANGTVHRGL